MIALRWFAPLFGRLALDSHVRQILDTCREQVWGQIEGRSWELSRSMLIGYIRFRSANVISVAVQQHVEKFGLQGLESQLIALTQEQLVPEMLQRASRQRAAAYIRLAA